MKSISRMGVAMTLCWMLLVSSCATWGLASPPTLANRSLELSPDFPGFYYQYSVCDKKFLGICTHASMHRDTYDLTNATVRAQLRAMGFIGVVRPKQ